MKFQQKKYKQQKIHQLYFPIQQITLSKMNNLISF